MAEELNTPIFTSNCSDEKIGVDRFYYTYIDIHGYLAVIICICGILSNLANIIVLSRPKMSSSPVNYLLTVIAAAEMMLMITYIPHATVFYIFRHPNTHPDIVFSRAAVWLFYFCTGFEVVCHSIAIWHTIAVAIFRWLTLGIPHGKVYSTMKNAYICSVVLIVINCLLSIPNWMTYKVVSYNYTSCFFDNAPTFYLGARDDLNFNNWLYACFSKILPSVMLTILTILLLCVMRQAKLRRKHLLSTGQHDDSRRQKEHNRTTGMLLAVVVIFLMIELPHGILIILIKDDKNLNKIYMNIAPIIDILTLIAFSVNFILYTVMSRLFRSTFFSLFCKKPLEQRASNVRRLSTMVTSVRMTVTPKKSVATSQLSNTSDQQRVEEPFNDGLLSPLMPIIADHSNSETMKSDCSTEPSNLSNWS